MRLHRRTGGTIGPRPRRSDTASASTSATAVAEPGVSEAEVTELEQQLDEIDRVLADLEVQLSED